eukprot:GFYU01002105.1.p1 GENE.GFYU01002105.1~~GFYU01002105.1.p1  ORF type:complete len:298 (+),score=35.97 GFYU01002105.1:94-987(+)
MGNSSSSNNSGTAAPVRRKDLKKLAKETHFTVEEVEALYRCFSNLAKSDKNRRQLNKDDFAAAFKEETLLARHTEFRDKLFDILDTANNDHIDFQEFVSGLAVFSAKAPFEDKLRFSFSVYDIDGDNCIKKDELRRLLLATTRGDDDAQNIAQVEQMVQTIFQRADSARNDKISFQEYREFATRNPTILNHFTIASTSLGEGTPMRTAASNMAGMWSDTANEFIAKTSKRASSGHQGVDVMSGVHVGIADKYDQAKRSGGAFQDFSRLDPRQLTKPLFKYDFSTERGVLETPATEAT